jgi:hypothetical protein
MAKWGVPNDHLQIIDLVKNNLPPMKLEGSLQCSEESDRPFIP